MKMKTIMAIFAVCTAINTMCLIGIVTAGVAVASGSTPISGSLDVTHKFVGDREGGIVGKGPVGSRLNQFHIRCRGCN